MDERLPRPEEAWDRFIDALDRAGQAGSAAGVRVPIFAVHALGGKAFGELSRGDVKQLSRVASALGGRADTILTMPGGTAQTLAMTLRDQQVGNKPTNQVRVDVISGADGQRSYPRGSVALVGAANERVAGSESANDLRPAGEQGHDSHRLIRRER